jgi:hypothetical protein
VAVYLAGTTTLASVYSDEALSVTAANPQTLLSMTSNGVSYGKFAVPIYTGAAYELVINSTDETGVMRQPLTTLVAQDASLATVMAAGGSEDVAIEDIVARVVYVTDYGEFLPTTNPSASSSTNAATLASAIGVVSSNGGGEIVLPAGTFAFTSMSIPTGVLVKGQGRAVTVLQSILGSKVVTYAGDRAGLESLTIDGVSLVASSIGVYALAKNETRFADVLIKNFATGLKFQGGQRSDWEDLYIDNCVNGALLYGDDDTSDTGLGDDFKYNGWDGGMVSNCTTTGILLKYIDRACWHNTIEDVGFVDNTGIALQIFGARWTDLKDDCWFSGNTTDIDMRDGTDTTLSSENTVVGFRMDGGAISSDMNFTGKCQDVMFDHVEFSAGTVTLTTVSNAIISVDALEGLTFSIAGNDATQWLRTRTSTGDWPTSYGLTTDATVTEAWSYDLAPGERVIVTANVIANGRNVIDYAVYSICQGAHRPGSTLAYDGQTVNFTKGDILTGATSGATGIITADSDSGATGTLTLRSIEGEFVDDETITDESGGTALANGVLSHQNAALLGSITHLITAIESDAAWACIFGVTAAKVRVLVTGAAVKEVEWSCSVQVASG